MLITPTSAGGGAVEVGNWAARLLGFCLQLASRLFEIFYLVGGGRIDIKMRGAADAVR